MNEIRNIVQDQPLLTAVVMSAATLMAAYSFQWAGYAPCDLCWTQRYPYMAIITIGILALALKKQNSLTPLLAVTGLAAYDAGVAMYHTGVEQKWWQGPTSCSGNNFDPSSVNISMETLYNLNESVVRCDEIPWSLFGISMAGFNAIIATSLTVYCVYHLKKRWSK